MADTPELSDAKRALLAKYLGGDLAQAAPRTETDAASAQTEPAPVPALSDLRSSVLPIQVGGSKPPFFFSHVHVEGGAYYCFTLSRALGPDQPFYVLEPYRLDDLETLPTFETMAADYVESLRRIQPEGPYLLGGFCGGALIAFEMAQQLHAQGQPVDLLLMVEPRAGPDFVRMISARLMGNLVRGVGTLARLRPERQIDLFLLLRHSYRLVRYRLLQNRRYNTNYKNWMPLPLAPTRAFLRQDWISAFVWMVSLYRPRRYPGKLTYLWAQDERGSQRAGTKGFVSEAKEVEIQFIQGNRESCRNEYVDDMVSHMRACVDATARTPASR